MFQYRYGRAFAALSQLRHAGFLTRALTASLGNALEPWHGEYYANPWRGTWAHEFGGAILSHAIHAHDLLVLAFGPVAEVSAHLATRVNSIETEDCAAITFCMKNGANATSSITLGAADNTSRLRLIYHDMTIESTRLPYTPGEAAWTFQARNPQRQDEVDQIIAAVDCPSRRVCGVLRSSCRRFGWPIRCGSLTEGCNRVY